MIRAAFRDLFPSRATVGALRARIAELEHENKALGEAYARVNSYNANISAECDRLEAENADLRKRALRPDLGAIEVAFYAGWDKGYHGAVFDRMVTTEYDTYDERARAADAYMNEIAKETT